MNTIAAILGWILLLIAGALLLACITAFPVKWLWNWLIPSIFHLRTINVFEAWGLAFLCSILFKSSSSSK